MAWWLRPGRFGRWIEDGSVDPTYDEDGFARKWGPGIAVTMGAFVLYVLTTSRFQVAGDTTDFLLAAKTSGVAHAPGYPTLVMLAHLFTYLPFGTTVFRMDLLSGVCSAMTIALVYASGLYLTRRPWAAAGAALALAVAPLFWKWSLVLETFPLNNAIVAGVIYLLIRWHREPERAGFLYGAALVFGLGLTNQQTIALLVPAIGLLLWWNRATLVRRPAMFGWSALAIVVGLIPYAYVPIAAAGNSPENWDRVRSFSAFLRMIRRQDYGGTGFASVSAHATGTYLSTIAYFFVEIGVVMLVLAIGGAVVAYFRQRWYLVFVLVAFVSTLLEFVIVAGLNPRIPSQLFVLERFYLMPLVILAPLGAGAIAWASDWLALRSPVGSSSRRSMPVAVGAFVGVICAVTVASNYSTNDYATDKVTDQFARTILNALPRNAIVFTTQDFADFPMLYANKVEGVRPDVSVIISPILAAPWYQASLRDAHQVNVPPVVNTLNMITANSTRPIAFVGSPPDQSLASSYYLAQDGLFYNLEPRSTTLYLPQFTQQNSQALASYHIPSPSSLKSVSFEGAILESYANVPATIAQNWAADKQYSQAVTWYQRALAIDPGNPVIEKDLTNAEQHAG